MKISETTFTVSMHGTLKIPRQTMAEMGLYPGDSVRVAYLSEDGEANTFQEFLLTKNGFDSTEEDARIAIPTALLKQAGLPESADVQVVCGNGAIILCADPLLHAEALEEILSALGIATDILSQLPGVADTAIEMLRDTFNQEGADEDDKYTPRP